MLKINFGMPTLIEASSLEECVKLCTELGLDFIELNMNMPQYQLPKIDVDYFKNIADKYGIYYTIHLDENLNVSDFNPYVAEAYTKTVADTIEIAKQLGVRVVNMHMARGVPCLTERSIFSRNTENNISKVLFCSEICAKSLSVILTSKSVLRTATVTKIFKRKLLKYF